MSEPIQWPQKLYACVLNYDDVFCQPAQPVKYFVRDYELVAFDPSGSIELAEYRRKSDVVLVQPVYVPAQRSPVPVQFKHYRCELSYFTSAIYAIRHALIAAETKVERIGENLAQSTREVAELKEMLERAKRGEVGA